MQAYPLDGASANYYAAKSKSVQRYRFMTLGTLENPLKYLETLSEKTIYFSNPENFNDIHDQHLKFEDFTYNSPFENHEALRCALKVLVESTPDMHEHWFYDDEVIKNIRVWVKDGYSTAGILRKIANRMRSFGVACFTENWDMQLFWAHYADKHQGICVEYNVRSLDIATAPSNASYRPLSVQYTSELPSFCLSEVLFTPHQVMPRALATKHIDWAYEREWRLIHFPGPGVHPIPDGMELSAIYVGARTQNNALLAIKQKGKELHVPVFRLR